MKAKRTVWECDDPDCKKYEVEFDGEPALGLRGTSSEITGGGGWGADWYACSREHVGAAVAAALDAALAR